MTKTMTWVGLDVHARSIHAAAINSLSGELTRARFGGEAGPVVDWLRSLAQPLHACYEAGPTGYTLYRTVDAAGMRIDVVAPSKTPRAAGDRIKHDRKDAELLARLLMARSLVPVAVPGERFEAVRDLARAREQLRLDLSRARHRVSKLLLRYGRVYPSERSTWTKAHWRWLQSQRFEQEPTELAFLHYLATIEHLVARRSELDQRLSRLALEPELWPIVARLRCFRGVETLTALALHLEIANWHRFRRPEQVSAWLGLVPSLDQSGESEQHGSITKTGSSYARRLLVEAAWHYRRTPSVGLTLERRQQGQPAHVLRIAWQAQRRLHRLHRRLHQRGKLANVATVAVARELACFLWAAAVAP